MSTISNEAGWIIVAVLSSIAMLSFLLAIASAVGVSSPFKRKRRYFRVEPS